MQQRFKSDQSYVVQSPVIKPIARADARVDVENVTTEKFVQQLKDINKSIPKD